MYARIDAQPSVADTYAKKLVDTQVVSDDELKATVGKYADYLAGELKKVDDGHSKPQ